MGLFLKWAWFLPWVGVYGFVPKVGVLILLLPLLLWVFVGLFLGSRGYS